MLIFCQMANKWQYFWILSSAKCGIFKLRWKTNDSINQLETNTRSTAKCPAFSQGPICQAGFIGLDANCGEPTGVELAISNIANYKDSLIIKIVWYHEERACQDDSKFAYHNLFVMVLKVFTGSKEAFLHITPLREYQGDLSPNQTHAAELSTNKSIIWRKASLVYIHLQRLRWKVAQNGI